jgi:hypothetical protein
MEHAGGRGRQAEVWVDGNLLTVCDNVSGAEGRCPPGPLEQVRFSYMSVECPNWSDAIRANRSKRRRLERVGGWSYTGYGQIISVMPVVIDFGLLCMEDPHWTTDEELVGSYVKVAIDRLEIGPPASADWPSESF